MNTHADHANTLSNEKPPLIPDELDSQPIKANIAPVTQAEPATRKVQVLSSGDENLYRAIFFAQTQGNWKEAEANIAKLGDRRLLGHVLADQYERRPATANELRTWLTAYSDLPEASEIYKQLKKQPGMKGAKFDKPARFQSWAGEDSYEASFGFRTEDDDELPAAERKVSGKIYHALRRGNPASAEDLLYKEMDHRALAAKELGDIQGRIAAGFFYAGNVDHARDLAVHAMSSRNPLVLWIAGLSAWKQGDAHAAAEAFVLLAAQPDLSTPDKAAAEFWAARSLTKLNEPVKARFMLELASKQPRTFYGLLAAALIGRDTGWSWDVPKLSDRNLATLGRNPAGFRALALLQIDQPALAEGELRHLNPQGRHDLQEAMVALAETEHMPSLAVQLGGIATSDSGKRYDAALYPVPPWQPEEGFQVDRALMYALIRRESYFNPTAVSGRGACGLMQLMPKTANLVAKHKVAGGGDCSGKMLDPSYNMALGQKYVRRLSQEPKIGTNLLFLLAAYNSGPGNLAHWTGEKGTNDPLLFMESMPVHETRDYVQQVLMHYWTYRARLSEPVTSIAALARGEWPRYALSDETKLSKSLKTAQMSGYKVASAQK